MKTHSSTESGIILMQFEDLLSCFDSMETSDQRQLCLTKYNLLQGLSDELGDPELRQRAVNTALDLSECHFVDSKALWWLVEIIIIIVVVLMWLINVNGRVDVYNFLSIKLLISFSCGSFVVFYFCFYSNNSLLLTIFCCLTCRRPTDTCNAVTAKWFANTAIEETSPNPQPVLRGFESYHSLRKVQPDCGHTLLEAKAARAIVQRQPVLHTDTHAQPRAEADGTAIDFVPFWPRDP